MQGYGRGKLEDGRGKMEDGRSARVRSQEGQMIKD
jgi:hypothetical protein